MNINSLGSSVLSMDQHHGSCLVLQIPDPSFCHSFLEMRIDSTECDGLIRFLDSAIVLSKSAIVGLVALDLDINFAFEALDCIFDLDCLFCIG